MNPTQQVDAARHVYRLKGMQRWLYLFVGMVCLAGGVLFNSLGAMVPSPQRPLSMGPVMTLFLTAAGIYLFAVALRSRLVIEGSRIEVRYAIRERSADRSEIEGFRVASSRNGTYTYLHLRDGRRTIAISQGFSTDDDYRAWFQQLTDLDKRDREALLDEISKQENLGATPKERLEALATAKTWSVFLLIVAVTTAAGLNLAPADFRLPCAAVLALVPVAVLFLTHRAPLLYAIFKPKSDPRAEMSYALMVASFGFLFRLRGFHLVSLQPLSLIMVMIAVAYCAVLYSSSRKSSSVRGSLIAVIFFAGIYSYGLAGVADTLPDHSTAKIYSVSVIDKHMSSGRSTSYYLRVEPWGPFQTPNQVSVSSREYGEADPGDQVCLALHPGSLHAPWYQTVPCHGQPASDSPQ